MLLLYLAYEGLTPSIEHNVLNCIKLYLPYEKY